RRAHNPEVGGSNPSPATIAAEPPVSSLTGGSSHSSPSSLLLPDGGPATSREVAGPPSGSNKGCRWVGGARVLRWERRTPLGCPRGVRLERRELRRRCLSGPNRSASGSVARVTA